MKRVSSNTCHISVRALGSRTIVLIPVFLASEQRNWRMVASWPLKQGGLRFERYKAHIVS